MFEVEEFSRDCTHEGESERENGALVLGSCVSPFVFERRFLSFLFCVYVLCGD